MSDVLTRLLKARLPEGTQYLVDRPMRIRLVFVVLGGAPAGDEPSVTAAIAADLVRALATIGSTAPYVGLLGTVVGVIGVQRLALGPIGVADGVAVGVGRDAEQLVIVIDGHGPTLPAFFRPPADDIGIFPFTA